MNISRRENPALKVPEGDEGVLEEEERVLCLNCNDLMEAWQMASHEEICSEFVERPKNMDIAAFQEYLESQIPKSPNDEKIVLQLLYAKCNSILRKQTIDLERLLSNHKGSEFIKKCIMRVISFSNQVKEEKMKCLKKSIRKFQDSISKGTKGVRLDQRLISQVRDHMKSKNSYLVSTSTYIDSEYNCNEHSQQEAFYSSCLFLKQKLPSNHISQTVPISHLFSLSVQEKIKPENWHDFILKELKNPENYKLFTKRLPRRTIGAAKERFSILQL